MATVKICDICGRRRPDPELIQLCIFRCPSECDAVVDLCRECDEWLSRQLQDRAAALRTAEAEKAQEETEKHEEEPAHAEAGEH